MSGLLQNPDMIKMALEQMKNNPEMLKSMTGMMGPNHPLAGYIERSS